MNLKYFISAILWTLSNLDVTVTVIVIAIFAPCKHFISLMLSASLDIAVYSL